jgi:hypothetical protein
MRRALALLLFLSAFGLVAGCGKTGGSSAVEGIYHLVGSETATSLEVRKDGHFALRRDACEGIGTSACGAWGQQTAFSADIAPQDYWPTPDDFPSARVDRLVAESREGELVVKGTHDRFGAFTQRWKRGRVCAVCRPGLTREIPCDEPLPVCVR